MGPVTVAGDSEPAAAESASAAWGNPGRRESVWPARAAILIAAGLYAILPDELVPGTRYVVPGLEVALVLALALATPGHRIGNSPRVRVLAIALTALISVANVATLVLLVRELLHGGQLTNGRTLVLSSIAIYLTNIIVFGLWYWELDRGGPARRSGIAHLQPDFLFPQMVTPQASTPGWSPLFLDYLYVSFTNATAFSPTDTMPLTHAAKALMMLQSMASLVTVALVAARAVNILT